MVQRALPSSYMITMRTSDALKEPKGAPAPLPVCGAMLPVIEMTRAPVDFIQSLISLSMLTNSLSMLLKSLTFCMMCLPNVEVEARTAEIIACCFRY